MNSPFSEWIGRLRPGIGRKDLSASHIRFSIVFVTSLYVACNALTINRIVEWFGRGHSIDYLGLFAFLTFGLCFSIAIFLLFAHRWTIKPVAITLTVLGGAATYFIAKYNVAIERTMLANVVHTDVTEVRSLLSVHMLPYVVFLILLPVVLILKTRISFQRPVRYLGASIALFFLCLVTGVGAVYWQFNSIQNAVTISHRHVVDTLVPINIYRSLGSTIQQSIRAYRAENYREPEVAARVLSQDDLVVVLAIGETSRQKNFSLYGYDRRDTNPLLSQDDELHVLNGKARVGSTLLAIPEILARDHVKLPSVTARAGVDTSCLVNYTLYDNCGSVAEIETEDCGHGGKCYDEDVLPLLESNLQAYESGYRFVVLHLGGGSHGPNFSNRHPPEFEKFNPQCLEADVANHCSIEQIYNSYDNTILYVDYVVSKVIEKLDEAGVPYVFIYLSDHGESLMEDGRLFHGMPPGIPLPPEQAEIPLIVKANVPISIDDREFYTQQDVYDSVLELLSIETEIKNEGRAFIQKLSASSADLTSD